MPTRRRLLAGMAALPVLLASPAQAQENGEEPEPFLPPDGVLPLRFKEFYQGSTKRSS